MKTKLTGIHIGLTDNCNFGCDYCFYGKQKSSNLDINSGRNAIDFLVKHAAETVNIHYFGGEPLLRFSLLEELTTYALKKQNDNLSFNFTLVTNGSLLTDDMIDFLFKNHFSLLFSFDGIKKAQDIHRKLSNGKSSYNIVYNNLIKSISSNLRLIVRPTITPKNVIFLSKNIELLLSLGVKEIAFDLAYESGWTQFDMHILKEEIDRIATIFTNTILQRSEKNIIIYPFHDTLVQKIKSVSQPRCSGGKESLYVAPNGEIFFCCWFRGNEKKEAFGKIGNLQDGLDYKKLELINNKIDASVKDRFGCPKCAYDSLCNKYCIAHNFLCTGHPYKVAPAKCAYEKIRIASALQIGRNLFNEGHPYINNMIGNHLFTL